jgi:uncharacterized cofD-like protein
VIGVQLMPKDPPACAEAITAIREADWVVLGPGSWFTSVLPHVLVPQLAQALRETSAQLCVTLNLGPQLGETDGFSPEAHLEVLSAHAPDLRVDVVLADERTSPHPEGLRAVTQSMGAQLLVRNVAQPDGSARHDPLRLAAAFRDLFAGVSIG